MTEALTRAAASSAVEGINWRYLLGTLTTAVHVASMEEAVDVVASAVGTCGRHADAHLAVDVRPDHVVLTLRSADVGSVTQVDLELAYAITAAVRELGMDTTLTTGEVAGRAVQTLELAIDTMDAAAIRPFWKAVLGYVDETDGGPMDGLVDPARQGPTFWFQQMDRPRPDRNRIHLDVTVPHDEADARIAAALAAGGRLVSDERARAFWVLADAEGNEVCVCTWQDRDR